MLIEGKPGTDWSSDSLSTVSEPAAPASPGNLLEMHSLRPIPTFLNQETGNPGDSDSCQRLRTTGLMTPKDSLKAYFNQ